MKLVSVEDELPLDTLEKLLYNDNQKWKGGVAEWNFGWYTGDKWVFSQRNFWTQDSITHWCDLIAEI